LRRKSKMKRKVQSEVETYREELGEKEEKAVEGAKKAVTELVGKAQVCFFSFFPSTFFESVLMMLCVV
jgi:hypothetical protein